MEESTFAQMQPSFEIMLQAAHFAEQGLGFYLLKELH